MLRGKRYLTVRRNRGLAPDLLTVLRGTINIGNHQYRRHHIDSANSAPVHSGFIIRLGVVIKDIR